MKAGVAVALMGTLCVPVRGDSPWSRLEILSLMRRACDWQLANLPTERVANNDDDDSWIRAVFFDGVMAMYGQTHNDRYLRAMRAVAEHNDWQPAYRFRFADDLAIGQLYTELYFIDHDPRMIEPIRQRWDQIMAQPMRGRDDWSWCDALFMAPPALARLSAATGDVKYLDFMDKQWWDTTDFLYDPSNHLFFRDKTFFGQRERNGHYVFWSRGNGWVLSAITRVLDYMPKDYPSRPRYMRLFTEMADRIVDLQRPDGFWRPSLLNPPSTPFGESSGTALYCKGLTWGINQGILDRGRYLPVVQKGWQAVCDSVEPCGKLDWVQKPGSKPAAIKQSDTAEYGVGALLLAGSEILKLKGLE
jgi:unsaturated rhamnogalacturonyl hydrolase